MPLKQREGLTVQSVDEETLILDLDSDRIHQLNTTASFIWGMIDETASIDQIVESYASRFEVEIETARSDVELVLNQLRDNGLIEA